MGQIIDDIFTFNNYYSFLHTNLQSYKNSSQIEKAGSHFCFRKIHTGRCGNGKHTISTLVISSHSLSRPIFTHERAILPYVPSVTVMLYMNLNCVEKPESMESSFLPRKKQDAGCKHLHFPP